MEANVLSATGPDEPVAAAPLRLPPRTVRFALPGLRGRVLTVAAPLAAATVAAIIAATAIAHSDALSRRTATGATAAALRALPRYHVALTYVGQFKSWKIRRTEAVVASTTTGRRIATFAPPRPYNAFTAIAGSADGRVYVLQAMRLTRQPQRMAPNRLYEVRAGARTATITALPIRLDQLWPVYSPAALALSADGTRLAITATWQAAGGTRAGLRVYDVASGRLEHSWPVLPPRGRTCCEFSPVATAPSWEANGRYIALDVSFAHCSNCVALVDTAAPGGSVQAVGKVIVRTSNRHYPEDWTGTIITPDGLRVIRSAMVGVRVSRHTHDYVPHIFAYSAASGELSWQRRGSRLASWTVVWSSRDGQSFVVARRNMLDPRADGFISAALFRAGRWVPVRLPARTVAVAW